MRLGKTASGPNLAQTLIIATAFFAAIAGGWLLFSITQEPASWQSYVNDAWDDYRAADYQHAQSAFEKQLRKNPENFYAHHGMGLTQQKLGKTRDALTYLTGAASLNPWNENAQIDLGIAHYQLGEYNTAIRIFEQRDIEGADNDAGKWRAWTYLRRALQNNKTPQQTEQDLRHAIATFKRLDQNQDAAITGGLGVAQYHLSNTQAAKDINLGTAQHNIEQAIARGSQKSTYYEALGRLTIQQNRYETNINNQKAQRQFQKALELNPNNANAHQGLGWTHYGITYIQQNDFEKAAHHFEQSKTLNPNNPDGYTGLGFTQRWLGQHDQSLKNFAKARSLDPNDFLANLGEGWTLLANSQPEAATQAFERAIQLNPNHVSAWDGLGWAHLQEGSTTAAIEALEKATSLDPQGTRKSTLAQAHLGWAYLKTGDFEKASNAFDIASDNSAPFNAFLVATGRAALATREARYPAPDAIEQVIALMDANDSYMVREPAFKKFEICAADTHMREPAIGECVTLVT